MIFTALTISPMWWVQLIAHIRKINLGGKEAQGFIIWKGFFSLNVQAVCDPKGKFTNLVARSTCSSHDSRVFVKRQNKPGI